MCSKAASKVPSLARQPSDSRLEYFKLTQQRQQTAASHLLVYPVGLRPMCVGRDDVKRWRLRASVLQLGRCTVTLCKDGAHQPEKLL